MEANHWLKMYLNAFHINVKITKHSSGILSKLLSYA